MVTLFTEDLKNLALELFELLKNRVGVPEITAAYAQINAHATELSQQRKEERALELASNPEKVFLARSKKRERVKERKRKAMEKGTYKDKKKKKKKVDSSLQF